MRSSLTSLLQRYRIIHTDTNFNNTDLSYTCPSREEIIVDATDIESSNYDDFTIKDSIISKTHNNIPIIVFNSSQKKFTVSVDPRCSVSQLKLSIFKTHKVQPISQRLFYMGKLLSDESTLLENGIQEPNTIVHLFPKPQTVHTQNSHQYINTAHESRNTHIGQFIFNQTSNSHNFIDEHEIRYRLKFLILLLFVYCVMELISLAMIFLHTESQIETPGNPTNTTIVTRQWQLSDYFDFGLSTLGLFISILGVKAISEQNRFYLMCYIRSIVFGGLCWMIYYVETQLPNKTLTNRNYFQWIGTISLSLVLPIFVWIICIIRACDYGQILDELAASRDINSHILELEGSVLQENQMDRSS